MSTEMTKKPEMTEELRRWLNGLEASMASIAEDSAEDPNYWARIYGDVVRKAFDLLQSSEKQAKDTSITDPNKKYFTGRVSAFREIYDFICQLERTD